MAIEISGDFRQMPDHYGKGHDRVVTDETVGVAAVFDGAGTAWASDIAQEMTEAKAARSHFSTRRTLGAIQMRLLAGNAPRLLVGQAPYMTTGAMIYFSERGGQLWEEHGGAGDSSILALDHESGGLGVLYAGQDNFTPAFLGAWNPWRHMKFGENLVLRATTYAVCSDGVISPRTPERVIGMVRDVMANQSLSAQNAVEAILENTPVYDDKALVIARAT